MMMMSDDDDDVDDDDHELFIIVVKYRLNLINLITSHTSVDVEVAGGGDKLHDELIDNNDPIWWYAKY